MESTGSSIQLGGTFDRDYGECLIQLCLAESRFSQWREATGIVSASQVSHIRPAQYTFERTQELFEDAKKIYSRYSDDTILSDLKSGTYNEQDSQLRFQREIASRCQKSTGLVKKAQWALYERKKLENITRNITNFVDELGHYSHAIEMQRRAGG